MSTVKFQTIKQTYFKLTGSGGNGQGPAGEVHHLQHPPDTLG